ncbi:MAG: MSMEG_0565 family glycosyltransferase [Actinobacteria bacterium]|nr:MSMEG_0565 family glycosyltransferase [Actinomycetota bacterium]
MSEGPQGGPRVALVTYSTKPRGGVVHTLNLAERLHRAGEPVHLFALGDEREGFYRPTDVPFTLFPAPPRAPELERRVLDAVDALTEGLATRVPGAFDAVHAEDCIAARAAVEVRDAHGGGPVVRTVHHIDDFTTPALVDCQRRSVVDPDLVLVVSLYWRRLLAERYGVLASVVTNGVDAPRFGRPAGFDGRPLRAGIGVGDRFLYLTVGGVEPRKGSVELIEALAEVRSAVTPAPVLVIVGGHSFQDHASYREGFFRRLGQLELELGRDVVRLGTVTEAELLAWYHTADAFVFPSVNEGWGLVVLEAMAAGLPVVTSDIPVFREYLTGHEALLVPPTRPGALAEAMLRLAWEPDVRARLQEVGSAVTARFTWRACARQHADIYRRLVRTDADGSAVAASGADR